MSVPVELLPNLSPADSLKCGTARGIGVSLSRCPNEASEYCPELELATCAQCRQMFDRLQAEHVQMHPNCAVMGAERLTWHPVTQELIEALSVPPVLVAVFTEEWSH